MTNKRTRILPLLAFTFAFVVGDCMTARQARANVTANVTSVTSEYNAATFETTITNNYTATSSYAITIYPFIDIRTWEGMPVTSNKIFQDIPAGTWSTDMKLKTFVARDYEGDYVAVGDVLLSQGGAGYVTIANGGLAHIFNSPQ